jgi:EmrB/QacA subfamily drug resistance transporter
MESAPSRTTAITGAPPEEQAWAGPSLSRREVMVSLGGVMLGMFLAALDQTIVGTAMPRIIGDLGGFDRYTWVTTAYIVSSTSVVLLIGRLSDIYGRKWLYIACLAVFLAGSALSGLSQSMSQLIAARAFQGVGAGGMMGLSFATMGDLFAPAERGKYQGLIAGMFGISSVIGPSLGGVLTDRLSWHWVFFVNLPLGIPVILLFLRFFPQPSKALGARKIDYLGAAAMILAIVPLLLGLSWGSVQYPWGSPQVSGALLFGGVMAAVFIVIELRTPEPVLPLQLFKDRIVSVSLAVAFLTGFAMFGAIIFMPLFFQGVLGLSATSSGGFTTPMSLGVVAGATLSGQALSRLGGHYRIQGLLGLGVMAAGAGLLTTLTGDTTQGAAVAYAVVLGVGLGTTFPTFTIAVQNTVPFKYMGVATSATQFFRSVGGSLGLALLGAFMVSRFAAGFEADLPAAARAALPPERIAALSHNPNAMVSEQGQQQLRASFGRLGEQSGPVADETLGVMRSALADAISDVFLVAVGVIVAALTATLFLKQVPLARRTGPAPEFRVQAGAGGAPGGGHPGTGAAAGPPSPSG